MRSTKQNTFGLHAYVNGHTELIYRLQNNLFYIVWCKHRLFGNRPIIVGVHEDSNRPTTLK